MGAWNDKPCPVRDNERGMGTDKPARRVYIVIQDDLTSLAYFQAVIQGHVVDES